MVNTIQNSISNAIEHPIVLQGVGASQLRDKPNLVPGDRQPTILQRTEQDFIGTILRELSSDRSVQALKGKINSASPNQVLQFLQPVHRTFYVVLLEVVCNPFENPYLQSRLDPEKIDSAGLVVRRVSFNPQGQKQLQGWRQQDCTIQGWLTFSSEAEEKLDPDPQRRPAGLIASYPELAGLVLPSFPALSESVSSLFVAPPDICQATGRTILYGLIPVTSFDVSESPPQTPNIDNADTVEQINQAIANLLPYYLRPNGERSEPNGNAVFDYNAADPLKNDKTTKGQSLNIFITTLQQLKYQFNLFANTPESITLFNELNQIILPNTSDEALGNFLKLATRVLVDKESGLNIKMPASWPKINQTKINKIINLIRTIFLKRLSLATAGEGRFEELARQYQIRAFVRLKNTDNNCLHQPIWSDYSNPFTIAPWYENSSLPPVKVTLPDILNPKTLEKLKPGVAFSVPPKLFNFLQNNADAKSLLKGEGKDSNDSGIAWICSFNIPIITLCAYIVLNIFLQLFNLFFWWLPLIKICLPVPKKIFK